MKVKERYLAFCKDRKSHAWRQSHHLDYFPRLWHHFLSAEISVLCTVLISSKRMSLDCFSPLMYGFNMQQTHTEHLIMFTPPDEVSLDASLCNAGPMGPRRLSAWTHGHTYVCVYLLFCCEMFVCAHSGHHAQHRLRWCQCDKAVQADWGPVPHQ